MAPKTADFKDEAGLPFFLFFLNIFYCCSSTVFCLPPDPSLPLQPSPPPSPVSTLPCYCLCVLYSCSCKPFTLSPYNPPPSPLWSLSAYSQLQCLWLYFACLFVLLIRFLLKVRSYGICLSPHGLILQQYGWNWRALC